MADQERVEALRNVISRLPAEQTVWAAQWAKEAFDAGTPIVVSPSLPETWTERRCDLSTAAIRLSHIAAQDDDEARARATVAIIIDDAARVTTPIGAAIGQCDNTQAAKLLAAAERVLDGADLWGLAFDLDPTGVETVRWTDPAF